MPLQADRDGARKVHLASDCEKITQPRAFGRHMIHRIICLSASLHATPRGFIGPQLLATILFDKFGMHTPLNRQSARFKCEGVDLSLFP